MKKILSVLVLVFVGYMGTAASSDYFVNDAEVEHVLTTSVINDLNTTEFDLQTALATTSVKADKSVAVSAILAWFLGGLAIHRVYLGGKGGLILIYFITCGGIFGIVPLVDFFDIILGNMDRYIDNDKFIVW